MILENNIIQANYLASPLLVIAYALAGRVDIDFEKEPIGQNSEGKDVFLSEIWPSRESIQAVEAKHVIPEMFSKVNYCLMCKQLGDIN